MQVDDSEDESDEDKMDMNKIYRIIEDEVYAHGNGMQFDTKSKNNFT